MPAVADLEAGLRRSIVQYREILEGFSELEGLLGQGQPEAIRSFVGKLNDRQSQASLLDEELLAGLEASAPEAKRSELFLERRRLIETVLEQNRLLSEEIAGSMAVLSAELAQVKGGRTAVSGYKSGRDARGRLVHGAC